MGYNDVSIILYVVFKLMVYENVGYAGYERFLSGLYWLDRWSCKAESAYQW